MARKLTGLYKIQNGKISEIVHFNEHGNAELTRQVIRLNANSLKSSSKYNQREEINIM